VYNNALVEAIKRNRRSNGAEAENLELPLEIQQ
jgi:hypothetical protein